MGRVEREDYGALAGELNELLELLGGVHVVAPGGGGGGIGLITRGCRGPLRAGGGVQLHGVAHRGGDVASAGAPRAPPRAALFCPRSAGSKIMLILRSFRSRCSAFPAIQLLCRAHVVHDGLSPDVLAR